MDASPLAKLPPELRDQIYEHTLRHHEPLTLQLSSGRPQLSQPYGFRPLALAQTCKQLRHESLPTFFRCNSFAFRTDHIKTYHDGYGLRTSWLSVLRHWLDLIGGRNRQQLRDVDFDIETWDIHLHNSNGQTAKLVWDSLLPAMELFDASRTRLGLRCNIHYYIHRIIGSTPISRCDFAELRISLLDADAAGKAVKTFFERHGWSTNPSHILADNREQECLKLVDFVRERSSGESEIVS